LEPEEPSLLRLKPLRASIRAVRTRRVDWVRWNAALLAFSLVVVSCSSSESADTTTTVAPTTVATTTMPPPTVATTTMPPVTTVAPTTTLAPSTTVAPGLVATLPRCEGGAVIPASIGAGQVGFITGGAVYVADPDGTNVQCVTEVTSDAPFVWGPMGDRLVAAAAVISDGESAPAPTTAVPTWSRPTGTALVWVDDGRLLKARSDGTGVRDLTFLARHDAVSYHPAGLEIATTGRAADGTRGVWLAGNEGGDPRLVVLADEATVHDFTFNHDGVSAYFLADHGDQWQVHDIFLLVSEDDPGGNEFDVIDRYKSAGPLSHLVVSPWDRTWAVQEGTCGSGSRVVIGEASLLEGGFEPHELAGELAQVEAIPVGWLPDRQLVVAAVRNGCDGAVDLWVVDVVLEGASSATLLVTDVDGAAVRVALPDPPAPLGEFSADEFG
jgi:hypothetical protein